MQWHMDLWIQCSLNGRISIPSSVALAHLVDNLPAGAGMDAYRPVYARVAIQQTFEGLP